MDAPDWKNLGDSLIEARGERSRPEVAAASGVSVGTIEKYETRNAVHGGRVLRKLAAFYGWSLADLNRVLAGGTPAPDPLAGLDDPLTEDERAALKAVADGLPVSQTDMPALRRAAAKMAKM
jgi:transcriptional regulator with XRE-family HTH domain